MTPKQPMIELAITLRDGTRHAFLVSKMPRHWKSWLMHQLPYTANKQGATFERRLIAP